MNRISRILSSSLVVLTSTLLLFTSCSGEHFINNRTQRKAVKEDFNARKEAIIARAETGNEFGTPDQQAQLFEIFNADLTTPQREALEFIYAYMPLGDITAKSGEYFLENVNLSFQAREEMPWGKDIPELEFTHFVLPMRVNNANLDDSRKVFYAELKDRIKNLSLKDAVLEVNHWCHEKVVYTPSDYRTASPLSAIRAAKGRCGEESTFTVAALRAVGIPARQVYTPRWAHTDDNHAWVEAWVDGDWYFLGACEPEPVLNLGWFNAPASRGMLMHTRVFGRYFGKEEVVKRTPLYTEINVIDNYAKTGKSDLTVVDTEGNPVEDALVEFKIYNYGEFHTVARKNTDKDGHSFLTCGLGDMLVWVSKDGKFGFRKVSFGKDENVKIVLDKTLDNIDGYAENFDIVPPAEGANLPPVTDEQRAENTRRMEEEDAIRGAYEKTFMNEETAEDFAVKNGYEFALPKNMKGKDDIIYLLINSRGNHAVICQFLESLKTKEAKENGIDLLQRISHKDLYDVTLDVLEDAMTAVQYNDDKEIFEEYVRNPRVCYEMITPYRSYFNKVIPADFAEKCRKDPNILVKWVRENILVDTQSNLGGDPITPIGVWKARMSNPISRDVFFVSVARSMGIPARIDGVTQKVQILNKEGQPVDIMFEAKEVVTPKKGFVKGSYEKTATLDNPKYYTHFTLAKLTDDGITNLLAYDEGDCDMGSGSDFNHLLKTGRNKLDVGEYMLTTGKRLASGKVLSRVIFFTIEEGKTTDIDLIIRDSADDVQVIGSFNSESLYTPIEGGKIKDEAKSVLSTTGRGYYVLGILGAKQEPTNHTLKDIARLRKQFEDWGQKLVLIFPNEDDYSRFDASEFKLPSTVSYGIDIDGGIQEQIVKEMKIKHAEQLPIFIIADTFNNVVFCTQGYTIGLGEQMMNVINKL